MPLLLVCVVLFFGVAQFYQWSNGLDTLPFPVLLLAGAGLAIVSNLSNQQGSESAAPVPEAISVPVSPVPAPAPSLPPDIRPAANLHPAAEPQLPQFDLPIVAQAEKSISFTLKPTGDRPSTLQIPPEKK